MNKKTDSINVIIHGFTGSSDEMNYLTNYLDTHGLNTHPITLKGHGGTKKDLCDSSYKDWLYSAESEVAKIKNMYKKINIIGFSMGGLICAIMSEKFNINKIVFINTPVYLLNPKIITKHILDDFLNGSREKIALYRDRMNNTSPKSVINFLRIFVKSRKTIGNVLSQSIILQCIDDEIVHWKSAEYLKNKISGNVLLKYYDGGCHHVFEENSDLKDAYCEEIFRFLA